MVVLFDTNLTAGSLKRLSVSRLAQQLDLKRTRFFGGLLPQVDLHIGGFYRVTSNAIATIALLKIFDKASIVGRVDTLKVAPTGIVTHCCVATNPSQLFFRYADRHDRNVLGINSDIFVLLVKC